MYLYLPIPGFSFLRENTPREKAVGGDFVKLMMCRGIRLCASPPGKGEKIIIIITIKKKKKNLSTDGGGHAESGAARRSPWLLSLIFEKLFRPSPFFARGVHGVLRNARVCERRGREGKSREPLGGGGWWWQIWQLSTVTHTRAERDERRQLYTRPSVRLVSVVRSVSIVTRAKRTLRWWSLRRLVTSKRAVPRRRSLVDIVLTYNIFRL